MILEVWNRKFPTQPTLQTLLQSSQPRATPHMPTWAYRLQPAILYCYGSLWHSHSALRGKLGPGFPISTQGTLITTIRPNPQKLPVLGGTTAPNLSPILAGATVHNAHSPNGEFCTTTSQENSSGVWVPASTPRYPASAVCTAKTDRATRPPITSAVSVGPSTSTAAGMAPSLPVTPRSPHGHHPT